LSADSNPPLAADQPKILGYESKWDPQSPYWTDLDFKEADLPESTRRAMVDQSLKLFSRLDCRDYARIDFRCGADGVPRLLEGNPNPGWVWDGKFNLQAGLAGYGYADLLRMILEAAFDRLEAGVETGSAWRAASPA